MTGPFSRSPLAAPAPGEPATPPSRPGATARRGLLGQGRGRLMASALPMGLLALLGGLAVLRPEASRSHAIGLAGRGLLLTPAPSGGPARRLGAAPADRPLPRSAGLGFAAAAAQGPIAWMPTLHANADDQGPAGMPPRVASGASNPAPAAPPPAGGEAKPAAAPAGAAPAGPAPGAGTTNGRPAAAPNGNAAAVVLRRQTVAPLPGGLDRVPVLNDNNPELIATPGILLSTFAGSGRGVPAAHLDRPLQGPFELFSHHVYAGRPETLDSTLWIGVVAAPRGDRPVNLRLLNGATALSQSLDPNQPAAPFLPLPALVSQDSTPIWAGPGSRVATELLQRSRSPLLPERWTLPAGQVSTLLALPIPVRGLDPLLNGRTLQLRLDSDGPLDVATLAAYGSGNEPPSAEQWRKLLEGPLAPREHAPTPPGASGPMVYSRVSGVQLGSTWRARLSDPGSLELATSRAPISWPISSLARGSLGTGQVQTAPLQPFYADTAWAAHGNYGVLYDLTIPLRNDGSTRQRLALSLDSPLKTDQPLGGLRFRSTASSSVTFRGSIEVSGLDGEDGRPSSRRAFHLVLNSGMPGPTIGTISLDPGQRRQLQVRLIYPADSTPPQVLTLLPVAAP